MCLIQQSLVLQCPHDERCPRFEDDTIPCNFNARYKNFDLTAIPKPLQDVVMSDTFSYVVFRKGESSEKLWPRVVADPIINKSHVICRLCTKEGSLQETCAHKQTNKEVFKCLKRSIWGKRLKVDLDYGKETLNTDE